MREDNYYDHSEGYKKGFEDATAVYEHRLKALTDRLDRMKSWAEIKRLEAEIVRLQAENQRLGSLVEITSDAMKDMKNILEPIVG